MSIQLKFLNHASVVLETQDIKLLFDPWFQDTAFQGGWQLQFHNPLCYEEVKTCTHLWISHFHNDHFHVTTLKNIKEINPNLIVLGNHSYHPLFQLDNTLSEHIGFKNVISLYERKQFQLTDNIFLIVFPGSSIDNMLLVKTPEGNILNYNDCNLPDKALSKFKKQMGTIDILLLNYNTAYKIMLPSPIDIASIIEERKKSFIHKVNVLSPGYTLPFASQHLFTSPYASEENKTLIKENELAAMKRNIIPWKIGDTLVFDQNMLAYELHNNKKVRQNKWTEQKPDRHSIISDTDLRDSYSSFMTKFQKTYWYLYWLKLEFNIKLEDVDQIIKFSPPKQTLTYLSNTENLFQITTNTHAFYNFLKNKYGVTNFHGVAQFKISTDISSKKFSRLNLFFLLAYLMEHEIDPMSIIKLCLLGKGIRFLWNRREKITALLFDFKIRAGEDRI